VTTDPRLGTLLGATCTPGVCAAGDQTVAGRRAADLGSRHEGAARAHRSAAAGSGACYRQGAHEDGGARPLDVAADAPVGARFLRPLGGRLGRARAARRAGAPAALAAAVARLEAPPAWALGLGAGTGAGALWLGRVFPDARVTGLDISEAMIERAKAKLPDELAGRVEFLVGDAERLPFTDGSLDLVAQISVPVFFDEVARVLAPRGYVVVVSSLGLKTPFHTPGGHPAQGLPPTRDRDCRDRGGGPRHILCGQALGLKRRPSDETACRRGAMLASGAGVNSKGSAAWRPAAERR
jgi:SAM-dependent methyltransferase